MDPLRDSWAMVPWWARLLLFGVATFFLGYATTDDWKGGAVALGTWIVGNQQNRVQDGEK